MLNKSKIISLILIVVLLVFGFMYIGYVWNSSLTLASSQALQKAKVSAIALDGEMLKKLHGVSEDIGTIQYESIKNRLVDLQKNYSDVRFIYFYAERNGRLYFMVDSEPEDSKDIAPAGMEYVITGTEYLKPFNDGLSIVTKPATDEWGTWISVLIPIKDPLTNKVTSVFAMDYPANSWNNQAIHEAVQAGIIVCSIFFVLLAFYFIIKSNLKLKESEKQFAVLFKNNPACICLNKLSDGKFVDANDAFLNLIGYKLGEVMGKTAVDLNLWVDLAARTEVRRQMLENGKATEIKAQWRIKSGELKDVVVDAVVIDIGGKKHYLGLIDDVTKSRKAELELEKKVKELEELNKFMIGRELKMVELKKQIKEQK